jgi:plastocyanin
MGSSIFFTATSSTQPVTVTVAVNTPVTWTNDSGIVHDVTFSDPSTAKAVGTGNPGNIAIHTSGTNQRQFSAPGTYPFHCQQHAPGMTGTVVVQ